MDYSLLKIKYIPALFPYVNFTDTHVINDLRIIKSKEPEIVLIQTENKFKTLNNINLSNEQIIQSIKYDKYLCEIEMFEENAFENIQLAENITLILADTDETPILVKLISQPEINQIADSTLYYVRFTFAALQTDDIIINNYKTADYINQKRLNNYRIILSNDYNIDNEIDFAAGNILSFYTEFLPYQIRSEMELSQQTLPNAQKVSINSSDNLTTTIKVILTRSEFLQLQKYLKRCSVTLMLDIDYVLQPTKDVTFTVKENNQLIDLFDVDIIFNTDYIKFYHIQ